MRIGFRKLQTDDFPDIHRWLNTRAVKERVAHGKAFSLQEVEQKYSPIAEGSTPISGYIIMMNHLDIGYIQTYLLKDFPDYNRYIGADFGVAAMDLFIGDENYIHIGLGETIIKGFLDEIIFEVPDVHTCYAMPSVHHDSAKRAFEKVGFKPLRTVVVPDNGDKEQCVMCAERMDIFPPLTITQRMWYMIKFFLKNVWDYI